MKVLVAAKHPPNGRLPIGGVQSWTATVAAELRRQGHEVVTWGPEFAIPGGRFDLGILSNASATAKAEDWCERSVWVCHGIIPAEAPRSPNAAFTSEEVRDHWKGSGPVIRQPVNLEFWSPGPSDFPASLVRYSYYRGLSFLPGIAEKMGLPFHHVSGATHAAARDVLRSAVVVLASGRCAVEAMACGAPVVICDDRPYQGPLIDNSSTTMLRNYSCRGGEIPDASNVARATSDAMGFGSLRNYAEQHHDVRRVVPQLLEAACCTC